MSKQKVLIFVVSFNAEQFIEKALERIPESVLANERFDTEILVIDDQSADQTFHRAVQYAKQHEKVTTTVFYNPKNLGYGGNQKLGYRYAIKHGFDAVLLLHGDGQYPPEMIEEMVSPILNGDADAVFGSRMVNKLDALKGGMPLYKWIGNQILTKLQNTILGSNLTEFHSGYRAYRVKSLRTIPFEYNSDYFDFDTDIIIQLLDTQKKIKEIPIPTYYGDEISRVNGIRYGWLILGTTLQSRVVPRGIFYDPKFDYDAQNEHYTLKLGYASSHQFALDLISKDMTVLDVGCGPGFMTRELWRKGAQVIALDKYIQPMAVKYSVQTIQVDLNEYDPVQDEIVKIDAILLLDILEHLKMPEQLLERLRTSYAPQEPSVVITTGNIAFIFVRIGLLLGKFNYGKRGILDMDHSRLFTFAYMRRLLEQCGYEVIEERGIPAPFPLALGENALAKILLSLNMIAIAVSRSLFSYQMAFVVRPKLTVDHYLANAQQAALERLSPAAE